MKRHCGFSFPVPSFLLLQENRLTKTLNYFYPYYTHQIATKLPPIPFSFFLHPHGSFGFLLALLNQSLSSAPHVIHEEHECLHRGETIAVFFPYFCRYFHAMVGDKVVNHLQLVEKGFFVKRFAPEIKSNRIKDFLYSTLAKLAFSAFLSYFFNPATAFTTRSKPVKEASTMGLKVMPLFL